MSSFGEYLSARAIRLGENCANRKKVLQEIALVLNDPAAPLPENEIFKHLHEREKLGSTALGHGIAVPHCRLAGAKEPRAAVLRLNDAIDFDAPDNAPVSLFCALVIGEEANDQHLQILANLAKTLQNPDHVKRLMTTNDASDVLAVFKDNAA